MKERKTNKRLRWCLIQDHVLHDEDVVLAGYDRVRRISDPWNSIFIFVSISLDVGNRIAQNVGLAFNLRARCAPIEDTQPGLANDICTVEFLIFDDVVLHDTLDF